MKRDKSLSFKVDENLHKELKLLAVKHDKTMAELLEEAVRNLLRQYDKMQSDGQAI